MNIGPSGRGKYTIGNCIIKTAGWGESSGLIESVHDGLYQYPEKFKYELGEAVIAALPPMDDEDVDTIITFYEPGDEITRRDDSLCLLCILKPESPREYKGIPLPASIPVHVGWPVVR